MPVRALKTSAGTCVRNGSPELLVVVSEEIVVDLIRHTADCQIAIPTVVGTIHALLLEVTLSTKDGGLNVSSSSPKKVSGGGGKDRQQRQTDDELHGGLDYLYEEVVFGF
mmetsp:Transcript_31766/g.49268  ORF Transcript_31766/g.49268 Transcript_31766/m.49268 type:complete len:110 (+) Transcript_31766:915-1244(+)